MAVGSEERVGVHHMAGVIHYINRKLARLISQLWENLLMRNISLP